MTHFAEPPSDHCQRCSGYTPEHHRHKADERDHRMVHGLSDPTPYDVVRATTVARMLYAAPAWWGFAGQQEKNRLQSAMRRLIRLRYLPEDSPSFEHLCNT